MVLMPFGNEYDGAPAVVIMDIVPNIRGLGSQRRTALWWPKKKKKKISDLSSIQT